MSGYPIRIRSGFTGNAYVGRGTPWQDGQVILTGADSGTVLLLDALSYEVTASTNLGVSVGTSCQPAGTSYLQLITKAGVLTSLTQSFTVAGAMASFTSFNPYVIDDLGNGYLAMVGASANELWAVNAATAPAVAEYVCFTPLSQIQSIDVMGGLVFCADGEGNVAVFDTTFKLQPGGLQHVDGVDDIRMSFNDGTYVYYVTADRNGAGAVWQVQYLNGALVVQPVNRTEAPYVLWSIMTTADMSLFGTVLPNPSLPEIPYWYETNTVGFVQGNLDLAIVYQQDPGDVWFIDHTTEPAILLEGSYPTPQYLLTETGQRWLFE